MPLIPYPFVNGHRYDWSSVILTILGIPYTGVRSITYRQTLEPGKVRGTRAQVTGRTRGTYDCEGSIEFYKEDFQSIIDALSLGGTRGYMEVSFPITVSYSSGDLSVVTDVLSGCRISSDEDAPSEGSDPAVVSCDLDIMYILKNGKSALSPAHLLR